MYNTTYKLPERSQAVMAQAVKGVKVRYIYHVSQSHVIPGSEGTIIGYNRVDHTSQQIVEVAFKSGFLWVRWEKLEIISSAEDVEEIQEKERLLLSRLVPNKTRVELLEERKDGNHVYPMGSIGTFIHQNGVYSGIPCYIQFEHSAFYVHPFDIKILD